MAKCELCDREGNSRLMVDNYVESCVLCMNCRGPDAHTAVRARRTEVKGHFKCKECSSPATHRDYCVYCCSRQDVDELEVYMENNTRITSAFERMQAFDKRPKSTAESRELSRPHPWQCNEEEP